MTQTNPEVIVTLFATEGEIGSVTPYGNGHINDTYLVRGTDGEEKYILQRINTKIFRDPALLMHNFASVTEYLRGIIAARGGDTERETINLVPTKKGEAFHLAENGDAWRLMLFVKNSISYDKVERPEQFYKSAVAFGNFQYLLAGFPADTLGETIKDFHNTPERYRQLTAAADADVCKRRAEVGAELAFAEDRLEFIGTFERAHAEGRLPLRVTHNDTKLNNILFDRESGEPICIIDLDTIMPGYSVNDFGDSIRFGATTALEDEADLSLVHFDISLYELYVRGFIEGAKGGLTEAELSFLPDAAMMMTLECGMRFLADYLAGDTYFKTSRPKQNLDRARNQFKLVADMESVIDEMRAIVKKYAKN